MFFAQMICSIEYTGSTIETVLNKHIYYSGKLKKKFWKDIWIVKEEKSDETDFFFQMKSNCFSRDFLMLIKPGEGVISYKNRRPHATFYKGLLKYLIVFHNKDKLSFFDEDIQFASMKKVYSDFNVIQYNLIIDDDKNLNLILQIAYAVIIIKEEIKKDPEYSQIASWFNELKEFNEYWKPKNDTTY